MKKILTVFGFVALTVIPKSDAIFSAEYSTPSSGFEPNIQRVNVYGDRYPTSQAPYPYMSDEDSYMRNPNEYELLQRENGSIDQNNRKIFREGYEEAPYESGIFQNRPQIMREEEKYSNPRDYSTRYQSQERNSLLSYSNVPPRDERNPYKTSYDHPSRSDENFRYPVYEYMYGSDRKWHRTSVNDGHNGYARSSTARQYRYDDDNDNNDHDYDNNNHDDYQYRQYNPNRNVNRSWNAPEESLDQRNYNRGNSSNYRRNSLR